MRTFSKNVAPHARILILAVLCASVGACGKKKGSSDSSDAEEELPPTVSSGEQPSDSVDQPAGADTVILPDEEPGQPGPGPSPSPPPQIRKHVYYVSGFLGLSFADNEAAPDGQQGWSHSYSQAAVGSNPSLTTGYRKKAE